MTTRGAQTITWDMENRPLTVSGGTSFVYDGDGNRVEQTSGGQTILYINQYYEKVIAGTDVGKETLSYYLGGTLIAQRTILSGTSTTTYIHQDSLGSTSVVSNSTGASISTMTYTPFGLGRVTPDTLGTTKEFTGQRLDATGLYYYGARYYDASIGRFISADCLVSQPSNPQNLNRYSYCLNNPLKYTDPSGHDQIIETGGVNDNGDTWYTICDGAGNLLGIATGIDELAQQMQACDPVSRNVDLPLGQGAADFINQVGLADNNTSEVKPIEKAGQIIFDTVGQIRSIPNTLLGLTLGRLSGGSPTFGLGAQSFLVI